MRTIRQYDKAYKEQAVKLASKKGCKGASEELGIPYDMLYGWIKAARKGELHLEGRDTNLEEENQRLRQANKELAKENKRLAEINRILKDDGIFAVIDCDWPPVCNVDAEIAYMNLFNKVRVIEEEHNEICKTFHRWDKNKHFSQNATIKTVIKWTDENLYAKR